MLDVPPEFALVPYTGPHEPMLRTGQVGERKARTNCTCPLDSQSLVPDKTGAWCHPVRRDCTYHVKNGVPVLG